VLLRTLKEAFRRRGGVERADRAAPVCVTPQDPLSHYRAGIELLGHGNIEAAAEAFACAIASGMAGRKVHFYLGMALVNLQRTEEALREYDEILAEDPSNAVAQSHRWIAAGVGLRNDGRIQEAMEVFDKALEVMPDNTAARFHRGLARLMIKEWGAGWADYEFRTESEDRPKSPFPFPVWRGQALAGKTILIYAEQGIGDEIMFASCLPDLIRAGARCIVECEPRLAKLYSRSFPSAVVHGQGQRAREVDWLHGFGTIDFQLACGSLPLHLRAGDDEFPKHSGYLAADPERVRNWRALLSDLGTGPKVGLSWRGGTARSRTGQRSIALEDLVRNLGPADCRFVSLQYGPVQDEIRQSNVSSVVKVHDPGSVAQDLDDLAALVCALDLTITVANTTAHLAGALGREAWVMLPHVPEWRYGLRGERVPWYPSLRLFRQSQPGDWKGVLDTIASELLVRGN
jgi:tetratricopeptide (TPR) repeat protein